MNTKLRQMEEILELARQANWSASLLAKACQVSPRTLQRFFFKQVGKTPRMWLSEQRQQRAIELLRDGSSVKEVAASLGYKHSTHFSRTFRAYWGVSPSARPSTAASSPACRVLV